MTFYFSLSGLCPALANQEYNMHFISTSNVGTALEIGEPIVNELT